MANANGKDADIDAALDFFIGDTPAIDEPRSAAKGESVPRTRTHESPPPTSAKSAAPSPAKTRMGRPPGAQSGEGRPKAKTSLALDRELMDFYRKQTWNEQCQFGELVERALREYADRNWSSESH